MSSSPEVVQQKVATVIIGQPYDYVHGRPFGGPLYEVGVLIRALWFSV